MKEKPILFSGPMVQAILEGRKTMTRRVAKRIPPETYRVDEDEERLGIFHAAWGGYLPDRQSFVDGSTEIRSPYQPGDILWVRETWMPCACIDSWLSGTDIYVYKADCTGEELREASRHGLRWRPSIHMPRAAARIFLRVTDVRVERVQDITLEDIEREGIYCDPPYTKDHYAYPGGMRLHWIKLWDTINAKRGFGWEANPWVWCYTFERCEGGANADV